MTKSNNKHNGLRGAVALSHFFLRERVREGDRVVDATCGNGHDTLLLARLVGPTGKVWAFDVQAAALGATRALLTGEGVLDRVELVSAGHERLAEIVRESVRAVVFNLGYLPGGDKSFVTRPENTVTALQQAIDLLLPDGLVTACVYTGHPGGAEEGGAVEQWAANLAFEEFNVWTSRQANRPSTAPWLLLVDRGGGSTVRLQRGAENVR